jgi:hypothetical protein
MSEPFNSPRQAALALLSLAPYPQINAKTGGFLGQVAAAEFPLTPKQVTWLEGLLKRADLPPLAEGAPS